MRAVRDILLLALAFNISVAYGQSSTKPNLTGTWNLNLRKSKLGPPHRPGREVYKVKHSEPKIEIAHSSDLGIESFSFVTDGKERQVVSGTARRTEMRARAYWDGDVLVIEKAQEVLTGSGLAVVHSTSRYSLSSDGQLLSIHQHVPPSYFSPEFDEELVLERK